MSSRTPTGIWPKRIFLAHGPGDAGKTLLAWAEKREDDSITARTYSSQIYDLATELGAQVEVLVDNPNGKRFSTDNISVEPFPMRSANYKGARFWIEVERHAAQMADRAARFGADLAIVHNHYSLIALPAFARRGIPTVLTMHNTLWPMGGRLNARKRALFTLAAPILRRSMGAAVVVSPECGRQLKELLGDLPVFAHVPQYPAYLSELVREPTRETDEFRLLFAGRLEPVKGIFDIVQAARILKDEGVASRVRWVIAGSGPAERELKELVNNLGVADLVRLKGKLRRDELVAELVRADATITPTQRGFAEGLAKAPLESLLVGIPALVSSVVPAKETVADAAVVFEPESPVGIARAVVDLVQDEKRYRKLCENSGKLKQMLFDEDKSYRAAMRRAISLAMKKSSRLLTDEKSEAPLPVHLEARDRPPDAG